MALQQDATKMTNQKMLVKFITEYVTGMLGDNGIAKQYIKALTDRDAQKSLNRLGQTHADIKKAMEALPPDQHNPKEEEVAQTLTQMLMAYNRSQKNEEVAIAIMTDAKSQMGTPSPAPADAKAPAPALKK